MSLDIASSQTSLLEPVQTLRGVTKAFFANMRHLVRCALTRKKLARRLSLWLALPTCGAARLLQCSCCARRRLPPPSGGSPVTADVCGRNLRLNTELDNTRRRRNGAWLLCSMRCGLLLTLRKLGNGIAAEINQDTNVLVPVGGKKTEQRDISTKINIPSAPL